MMVLSLLQLNKFSSLLIELRWICLIGGTMAFGQVRLSVDGVLFSEKFDSTQVKSLLQNWRDDGYVYAAIIDSATDQWQLKKGHKFIIKDSKVTIVTLEKDTSELILSKNPFSSTKKIIYDFASHGFPFASLALAEIKCNQKDCSLHFHIEKGPQIKNDTLQFIGESGVINPVFVQNMLGLRLGDEYNEVAFANINKTIRRIEGLSLMSKSDIAFENERAIVLLDAKAAAVNSFEGILGVQSAGQTGQTTVTGYFDLALKNLFNAGKQFTVTWNRFDQYSQSINLGYNHQMLFDSKVLASFDFNLIKQDTTFLNQDFGLKLGSFINSEGKLDVGYRRSTGSIISDQAEEVFIDGIYDFKQDQYDLIYKTNQLAYPFGFTNGVEYGLNFGFGQLEIVKNINIDEEAYDSLELKKNSFALGFQVKSQQQVVGKTMIYGNLKGQRLFLKQIAENQKYRIGGLRTVRGFNEQAFYTSSYAFSNLELRQYFESQAFFYAFYDQLIYYSRQKYLGASGFGFGMSLNSNAGLFTFALAVGKSKDNPINLSAAKIHFGFTSKF